MKVPFGSLIAELAGRSDRKYVAYLVGQIDSTILGAKLVHDVVAGLSQHNTDLREQIRDIEHEGDRQRERVVVALANSLVTPIDREDLFRFSNGIDDVLDNLRDFAREWDLYEMNQSDVYGPLLQEVMDGMGKLRAVVLSIVDDPESISIGALDAKKTGNRIRRHFQVATAELFNASGDGFVTIELLKHRQLLRRLDIVGLRIREAAVLLADAAVKRSH